MIKNRMFSNSVIESDRFMDIPLEVQALYIHLFIIADDDGFVDFPNKVVRYTGADKNSLKILEDNGFIICFDSGVVLISHWNLSNKICKDRYEKTSFQNELSMVKLDENGVYYLSEKSESSKVKESETKQKENINRVQYNELFDTVWSLYPKKIGKGKVSVTQKKKLAKIGLDELTRAVERYNELKKDTDMKYVQNGSTFFNSGYIDFLDCNYSQATEKPKFDTKTEEPKNRWSELSKDEIEHFTECGAIEGETFNYGMATQEEIEDLQKRGIL